MNPIDTVPHKNINKYTIKTTALNVRLHVPPLDPVEEHLPTVHGLPGPYPHAGSDPHNHRHEVLHHEDLEPGVPLHLYVPGTGDGVLGDLAHVLVPSGHPLLEVGVLVDEARDDDEGRQGVEDGEDAYSYHELLQFVGLGAVVLHHRADPEEGDEAGGEKDGAED